MKEPRKISFIRLNLGFLNASFSPFGTWQAKGKPDVTNGKKSLAKHCGLDSENQSSYYIVIYSAKLDKSFPSPFAKSTGLCKIKSGKQSLSQTKLSL